MSNQQEFAITEKTANAVNSHFSFPTGPVRLLMIRSTLLFEIRNPGMRITAKAPKATTILRKEFGLTGNPLKLLASFETILQMVEVTKTWDVSTTFDGGKLRLLTRDEIAEIKADHEDAGLN